MIYLSINGGSKVKVSETSNVNIDNLDKALAVYNVKCRNRKIARNEAMKTNKYLKPNTESYIDYAILYNDSYRIMSWKRGEGWCHITD